MLVPCTATVLPDELLVPQVDFTAVEFDFVAPAVEAQFDDALTTALVPESNVLFNAVEEPEELRSPRSAFTSVPDRHPELIT